MNETVIEIDRLPLSFVAAAAANRAELVSRCVRDAVARTLPGELAAHCGTDLDANDSYIFIDRIAVECTVGGHWPDDAIARVLAERVAGALARERQRGLALVFHDRAEYVSAHLAWAVDGGTASLWWFEEFQGLRHLPLSALIRTQVLAEAETGWESLARLSPGVLQRVLSALSVADVNRLLDSVPATNPGQEPRIEALIDACDVALAIPLASDAHRVVVALVQLVRDRRATSVTGTSATLRGLMSLLRFVPDVNERQHLVDGRTLLHEWFQAAGVSEAVRLSVMRLESPALIAWVTSHASGRHADVTSSVRDVSFHFTPFGGALLLAVVLVRSGMWHRWRDAYRERGGSERADSRAAHLALAVVARALAPRKAAPIERDPILRRVFCVPLARGPFRGPSPERSVREHAHALLDETARRIPGCEGSTHNYLRRQFLSFSAGVSADGGQARLAKAALDVLLTLSGLTRASVTLPDGRPLSLRGEDL